MSFCCGHKKHSLQSHRPHANSLADADECKCLRRRKSVCCKCEYVETYRFVTAVTPLIYFSLRRYSAIRYRRAPFILSQMHPTIQSKILSILTLSSQKSNFCFGRFCTHMSSLVPSSAWSRFIILGQSLKLSGTAATVWWKKHRRQFHLSFCACENCDECQKLICNRRSYLVAKIEKPNKIIKLVDLSSWVVANNSAVMCVQTRAQNNDAE